MKRIFKSISLIVFTLAVAVMVGACHDADPEYVHTDNLINQLFMMTSQQGAQYSFTIIEYDAQGNVVDKDITAEKVAGGYGMAYIEFPISQMDEIDLTKVYLTADVGYDVIIIPGQTGQHDITGDGIVVAAKGGNGKARKYRIYGYFN